MPGIIGISRAGVSNTNLSRTDEGISFAFDCSVKVKVRDTVVGTGLKLSGTLGFR